MEGNDILALRGLIKSWRERAKDSMKISDIGIIDETRKVGKYLSLMQCADELQKLIDG